MEQEKTHIGGTTVACMKDMRRARRYQLNEVVTFSWEHSDGTAYQMTGISHNISMNGICFVSAAAVEIGARVKLDLFLRSISRLTRAIQLHADGIVRRVESLGITGNRIAAEIAFQEDPEEMFFASGAIQ
jgi:PilZ domain